MKKLLLLLFTFLSLCCYAQTAPSAATRRADSVAKAAARRKAAVQARTRRIDSLARVRRADSLAKAHARRAETLARTRRLDSLTRLRRADSLARMRRADSVVRSRKADSLARLRTADSLVKARKADSLAALKDSLLRRQQDSLRRAVFVRDSLLKRELRAFARRVDTSLYRRNPYLRFENPSRVIAVRRQWTGKESLFYCTLGLLLLFALAKNAFSRYLSDLYKIFFRTSLKQRQLRDQLVGAPLPSLLFNGLFVLSGSLFLYLVLQHYGRAGGYPFWLVFAYGALGLAVIYTVKFVVLKLMGWLLRLPEATNTYIFIVFTTNKVLGIALLPCIIALAFMTGVFYQMAFTLSLAAVGLCFLYRYYLSYLSVHKSIKFSLFHFCLYLLAFEIAPLLLINKLLFTFFGES
ncbi:DUF4271 domain-containing protein [Paraflavisolibacter sp. H34]|uniref:DUF4271 domain-containing protein n=1 Tax=Huijunlia imazamoxiresistens TaxID=3127457 RepID=UPI003015DFD8